MQLEGRQIGGTTTQTLGVVYGPLNGLLAELDEAEAALYSLDPEQRPLVYPGSDTPLAGYVLRDGWLRHIGGPDPISSVEAFLADVLS